MKLPEKVVGFAAMKVPVVFDVWMVLGPKRKRAELVETGGEPERKRARSPVSEDWM